MTSQADATQLLETRASEETPTPAAWASSSNFTRIRAATSPFGPGTRMWASTLAKATPRRRNTCQQRARTLAAIRTGLNVDGREKQKGNIASFNAASQMTRLKADSCNVFYLRYRRSAQQKKTRKQKNAHSFLDRFQQIFTFIVDAILAAD